MGRLGTVISVERRDENGVKFAEVKVDLGGGNTKTALYMPPSGFDSWPFPGDTAAVQESTGLGSYVCLGFIDPKLEGISSQEGETVIYSRSAPGVVAAKIVLKTDGSIEINDGKAVLGADGVLTVPEDVVGGGKSLKTHTHGGSPLTTTATVGLTGIASIGGDTTAPN